MGILQSSLPRKNDLSLDKLLLGFLLRMKRKYTGTKERPTAREIMLAGQVFSLIGSYWQMKNHNSGAELMLGMQKAPGSIPSTPI